MKITKSKQIVKTKPKGFEVGQIKNSVIDKTEVNSIDELEWIVLNNPYNVSYSNGVKETDWVSQQILILDFDSGIRPEDVELRCKRLAFIPNLIYSTLSDTPEKRKFRVLFILDKEIKDYKIMKWAMRGLLDLFPEADLACKDLCRMYYPGKKTLFKSEELNETDWVIQFCHSRVAENDRFYEKFDYKDNPDCELPEKVRDYDWNKAIKEIKILDKFFNEEVRLSYDILFGLFTNAQYIYGGEKKMLERMVEINKSGGGIYFPDIKRGRETYPRDYFTSLKAVKKFNYLPKNLKNFSPFEEDWDYKNLLEVKLKKGDLDIIEEQKLISVKSANHLFKKCFDLAKTDRPFKISYSEPDMLSDESQPFVEETSQVLPENPIYLFKVTTGLGKTEAFIKENNAIIAMPFHKLKDEVSDRMLVPHEITPETIHLSNELLNDLVNGLRDAGLYSEVTSIIKSVSKSKGSIKVNKQLYTVSETDILFAKEYLTQNDLCRRTQNSVLTTHTRAINDLLSFNKDFYIFDEDPLNDIVDIDSFKIDFTEFDGSPYESFVKTIEDYLRTNILENAIQKLPKMVKPKGFDKFCALNKMGKLLKLLSADFIYKDMNDKTRINFCIKKSFLPNKKVFIMSASAPIAVYRALFGSRLIVIDITNIKSMGVVEQYTKRSFSQSGMANYNTSVYKELFSHIQNTKVITHLKHQNKFKSFSYLDGDSPQPHGFYFGKCSGGDKLNGYDVSVVGTPNKPDFVYFFLAEIIGLPNSFNQSLSDRIVEWNGFRFRFFTYEDETLRDIQLSLIESELLQAAGRGRFLRNKNVTKIFSSLPLKITTNFINKKNNAVLPG